MHRCWQIACCVILALGAMMVPCLLAQEPVAQPAPKAAPPDPNRAQAIVTFSDGRVLTGELSVMGGRPLTIAAGGPRQRLVPLSDLLGVTHEVETATMERPWAFKEAGKHEKIYFEGQYPLINFITRLHLRDGSELKGHLISAVATLKTAEGGEKIFLKRQLKGELNQTMEQVVYPTSLRFPEHEPVAGQRLHGTLEGGGKLLGATAMDIERRQLLTATVKASGDFDFGLLLPGKYDLTLFTDTLVLTGISDGAPARLQGPPLSEADRAAIREVVPLADDFFRDRLVLAIEGNQDFARVWLYKRRTEYYASDKYSPGGWLWQVEAWSFYLADGKEWRISQRFLLARHRQKGGEAVRQALLVPELAWREPGPPLRLEASPDARQTWRPLRDLDQGGVATPP